MKTTTSAVADLLNIVLSAEQVAVVIDALLSCDADERLNDEQVDIGSDLFDALCHKNPRAVDIAQGH